MRCSCQCRSECPDSTLIWVVVSWAGFVLSFPLSLSLSLFLSLSPGPCLSIFPHLFIVAISARAASLSHLFSLLSHYFLSTSSVCFPLFFVGLFHVYLSHACVLCYLHEHLSCLIKSRGVVLVLCAFVSLSSCCMWPLTRTVFLPHEKLQLSSLSSRQESSFTEEFIFFVFVPVLCHCSTDCLFILH